MDRRTFAKAVGAALALLALAGQASNRQRKSIGTTSCRYEVRVYCVVVEPFFFA
jgi:hypothetical protein